MGAYPLKQLLVTEMPEVGIIVAGSATLPSELLTIWIQFSRCVAGRVASKRLPAISRSTMGTKLSVPAGQAPPESELRGIASVTTLLMKRILAFCAFGEYACWPIGQGAGQDILIVARGGES